MLDISYLPLRPGTHPEVNPTIFGPRQKNEKATRLPFTNKIQVVARLRGALLQSSKLIKEGGGEGKSYADKEAAVSRLLQPPNYMRGQMYQIYHV